MNGGGWLSMSLSWAIIIALIVYCWRLYFKKPDTE